MLYLAAIFTYTTKMSIKLEDEQPLLPVKAAAQYLGMNAKTVSKAIKAGQLTARQIGKRKYLLRDELLKFLGK